jgi:hypothetical protein
MLCTNKDDSFIEDKSVWVAVLNDGTTIYADDNRLNLTPSSAWLRLKLYLNKHKLSIIKLGIRFRSHYEWLPENADGYYFANGISASLFSGKNIYYQILGYIEDEKIICRHYLTPSLIVNRTTIKDIDKECDSLWQKKDLKNIDSNLSMEVDT